jgi:type I restriction enzyme, S subunit
MANVITDNLHVWTSALAVKSKGRGKSVENQSPHGINKLRELILELAVRGKLVPQDSKNESAKLLLDRIVLEKRIAENDRATQNQPPAIKSGKDEPYPIPDNWVWTALGDITLINPRNEADDISLASFVPMAMISTSHDGKHDQEKRIWGDIKQGYTHFADGDIGLAKITPCFENSKAVVFSNLINGIGAGTTELHIARPLNETLCARFVLLYLKAPQFLLKGEPKMTGTAGQKRVPKNFFANNPFPLPPLAEQHRIVAKVDELMAICDQLEQQQTDNNATHQLLVDTLLDALTTAADHDDFQSTWRRIADNFDTLFTTEQSVDLLKQTILQLAVMGKLVRQNSEDEPARDSIKKTIQEKEQLIKEGTIKPQKKFPEIEAHEEPFRLPAGWEFVRLQSISQLITKGSSPKWQGISYTDDPSDILFITSENVGSYNLIFNNVKYVEKKFNEVGPRSILAKGDFLMNIVGASIGRIAIYELNDIANINQAVCLIRPIPQFINKQYLLLFFNSNICISYMFDKQVDNARANLSMGNISKFIIPFPPLAEQHRIVAKVDELFALCDALQERITESQKNKVQLADAIVERAVG